MLKTLLTALSVMLGLTTAIFVAGFAGITFAVWPVWIGDKTLAIMPQTFTQLNELKREQKFIPDQRQFYPGAPNEIVRKQAQSLVDATIENLASDLAKSPRRSTVLKSFKVMLSAFDRMDSGERDQVITYCERITIIVCIENSGELLNVWRYGFPYGWFVKS